MRRRFWFGCLSTLLGVLAMVPSCSSDDKQTSTNGALEGQDGSSSGASGSTAPAPVMKGPCLKVCLVNGNPWPLPPGATSADDSATAGESTDCIPGSNGKMSCVTTRDTSRCAADASGTTRCGLPPDCETDSNGKTNCEVPPGAPKDRQCVTVCAPAPNCKLVCDPFNAPQPATKDSDQAAPVSGSAVPYLPICPWQCPSSTPVSSCDPSTYRACGDAKVCVAKDLHSVGSCVDFDHGQAVGRGYVCGGSIAVSCALGSSCEGLTKDPVVGGTGVCN